MKTRMLKNLRKKAAQNVYVVKNVDGYAVMQVYTEVVKRAQCATIIGAKRSCDYFRRKNIIEMLDNYRAKKKRRVY